MLLLLMVKMVKCLKLLMELVFDISDNTILVKRNSESKDHKAKHGLYRSLFSNMVIGVSQGWTKSLELVGVGYRAQSSGSKIRSIIRFLTQYSFITPRE